MKDQEKRAKRLITKRSEKDILAKTHKGSTEQKKIDHDRRPGIEIALRYGTVSYSPKAL